MPNNLYSSSSSSSSSDADSGRNPQPNNQIKMLLGFEEKWKNTETRVNKVGEKVRLFEAQIDRHKASQNASCKTALDLLPLSKRSNGTQNEKSNEEVYKEKLEDFKLQLTELNEFFNKQQLTKDGRRRFIEDIARIIVNISELDDLIPYLIKEKSKTKTQDVSTVTKPQLTPSYPLPHSILTSPSARPTDAKLVSAQRSPVTPFSRQ